MCHVVLSLPVIGLILFWIFPLPVALPLYLMILTVSLLMYKAIMDAMKIPVKTGSEGLIGKKGSFVGSNLQGNFVQIHGELWNAESTEQFEAGDEVRVISVNGLHLKVESYRNK